MGIRDILVIAVLGGALPVCFFRPFFGVLMWEIVSFMSPQRFTFGPAFYFPWALAVALPTLAGFLVFSPDFNKLFSRNVGFLLIFWLWTTFTSFHNSQMPEFQHFSHDTWQRWQFVSKIMLMTVVTVAIVSTWERLRWLLLTVSLSFGFLVLKAVPFMIATGGAFRLYGPRGSMIADNNDFGLALNMTMPMFFFLAQTEENKKMRWLMRLLVACTIPAVFFTWSRGAFVGLAVIMFLMVMRLKQRMLVIPILVLAALFALFLTPEKWQERMNVSGNGTYIDDSAMSRFNAWHYCWNLVRDYPFTGAGFDAFTPELFNRYAPNPRDVHGPHSVYFGVLAEHGFPGFILYFCLIGSCFLTLGSVRKYARISGDERAGRYALMLQFSLIGFMISGAFLGRAYFDYFFTIIACVMILKRLSLNHPLEAPVNETPVLEVEEAAEAELPVWPSTWTVKA